jgi:tight adherence protein C
MPGRVSGRFARLPVLRAVTAIVRGRERSTLDVEVGECADTIAFALEAGLSPSAAVRAVAPYAHGRFAEALRAAASVVVVPIDRALAEVADALGDETCTRFAKAFERSASFGIPLAPTLRVLADDVFDRASLRLAEDVRRASVRVLVPLSILVLPAFVLACLVPLFVGGLQGIAG